MPKTAVHKDGELFLSESEVWLAGQGKVPSPTGDVGLFEESDHFKLSGFISLRPDGLHIFSSGFRHCFCEL